MSRLSDVLSGLRSLAIAVIALTSKRSPSATITSTEPRLMTKQRKWRQRSTGWFPRTWTSPKK